VSAQGLTYPHDFDLSKIPGPVLHRINLILEDAAKLLISLTSFACRESGQDVANRDAASVCEPLAIVFHKVTHSYSGEK
jgi:hypothetical protein